MKVVLPAPFGPVRPYRRPGGNDVFTPSNSFLPANALVTFVTWIISTRSRKGADASNTRSRILHANRRDVASATRRTAGGARLSGWRPRNRADSDRDTRPRPRT